MSEKNIANTKTIISPNLLPEEAREELYYQTIAETTNRVIQLLGAALLFFWLLGGILLWRINNEAKNLASSLEGSVENNKLLELKNINDQSRELRTLNAKIDKSLQKEYRFSEVLTELPKIVPPGVVLTNFEVSLDQPAWVKIKGAAKSRDDFMRFKKSAEESNFYEKVSSPLSNYVNPESVNFELDVLLRGWKPVWEEDMKKKSKPFPEANEKIE